MFYTRTPCNRSRTAQCDSPLATSSDPCIVRALTGTTDPPPCRRLPMECPHAPSIPQSHQLSGRRTASLPTPFLLWGEGFTSPHLPPPPGPRRRQEGLGESYMASKMTQDGSRCLSAASNMLQEASRAHPDGSKWLKSFRRRPPRGQPPSKTNGISMIVASSPFRFRWASEAWTWPEKGPRQPQEGPKRAP